MARRLFRLGAVAILFLLAHNVHAEYTTVRIERPFHARSLTGITLDPSGAPVAGVVVEESDSGFEHILSSTTSDEKGRFSFPHAKRGPVHYLSFRARGFNPLQVCVVLRTFASSGLKVKLPIGG